MPFLFCSYSHNFIAFFLPLLGNNIVNIIQNIKNIITYIYTLFTIYSKFGCKGSSLSKEGHDLCFPSHLLELFLGFQGIPRPDKRPCLSSMFWVFSLLVMPEALL